MQDRKLWALIAKWWPFGLAAKLLDLFINADIRLIGIFLVSKRDLGPSGDKIELLLDIFKGFKNHPKKKKKRIWQRQSHLP